MKKRSGTQRAVAVLERERLDTLSTKQLLARLARLRFCEESAEVSDLTPQELGAVRGILFKCSPEWRTAYVDLRKVLASREHVSRTSAEAAVTRRRQR